MPRSWLHLHLAHPVVLKPYLSNRDTVGWTSPIRGSKTVKPNKQKKKQHNLTVRKGSNIIQNKKEIYHSLKELKQEPKVQRIVRITHDRCHKPQKISFECFQENKHWKSVSLSRACSLEEILNRDLNCKEISGKTPCKTNALAEMKRTRNIPWHEKYKN